MTSATLPLTVGDLGEHAVIARITDRLRMPSWVVVGPGDDAAVIKPARGRLDVLTTDTLVEGVHFDRAFCPPASIGHRALAVNISDLAAMGATPRAALLSLALPPTLPIDDLDGFVQGWLALAGREGVTTIGGNVTRTSGPFVVTATATGSVAPRAMLTRHGARPGDAVYVTGSLGAAATGLASLKHGPDQAHEPALASCRERFLFPTARVAAGRQLARGRTASSCMDLSDGLADGLRQIAAAAGVGMVIDGEALPLPDAVRAWHRRHGGEALATALSGGDDYELLFTVRPRHMGRLRGALRRMGALPVSRIGVVTKSTELLLRRGEQLTAIPRGFEHFR